MLGPNCLGLLVPGIGLNASFAHAPAVPGELAFVSHSGALCTAVLDWARARGIGFSHFVSLGNSADVDLGDVLDYLGSDPGTRAVLLYIESIRHARKFLSAARATARNKPVVAIKAGRVAEGERAASSHTGALAGSDDVYEAALERAGILRVDEIEELFDAVETLARARPLQGARLAIVTNGGGPGVMATDSLVSGGGVLARLSEETLARLDQVLPASWSRADPVDIIGDASAERYTDAVRILLEAPEVDALLVMHAPTAVASGEAAAAAVIEAARGSRRVVLTSWLGREAARAPRRRFAEAGIPTYDTPGQAVGAFLHLVQHRGTLDSLMETPPSVPDEFAVDLERARKALERALAGGGGWLTEPEAKDVLAAYGVPIVETRVARDAEEAAARARELGFPVALKILSPDVVHKSDVGGVALDLEGPEAVLQAAHAMLQRVRSLLPEARVDGLTVQRMARRPGSHELIVGASTDPVFGPFLLFGEGGTAVEVIADKAVALPPLNLVLARRLVDRTRVARLLRGYRNRPPVDFEVLCRTVVKVAQITCDLPEVAELEINPLLADDRGVLALDARLRVAPATGAPHARLAIRPYPRELEEVSTIDTGRRVRLRPIRPEDESRHRDFFDRLSPEDVRFRFFHLVRRLPHSEMARYTQIDYDREMAFLALDLTNGEEGDTLGVVRAVADPDGAEAEFAIIVRSDLKGQGLGRVLLAKMIRYCRERGIGAMVGRVRADNPAMLGLARSVGFGAQSGDGDEVEVRLRLR